MSRVIIQKEMRKIQNVASPFVFFHNMKSYFCPGGSSGRSSAFKFDFTFLHRQSGSQLSNLVGPLKFDFTH
jgi:hypothetical protein